MVEPVILECLLQQIYCESEYLGILQYVIC